MYQITVCSHKRLQWYTFFWQCIQRDQGTQRDMYLQIWLKLHIDSSESFDGRRSFKLWYNYTLKASLRRYSSLAISSATQPGISGMATWMMYFRRIAKCCKPPRPQRDRLNTQLHQGTTTFCFLVLYFLYRQNITSHTRTKNSCEVLCSSVNLVNMNFAPKNGGFYKTTTTNNSRPCTCVPLL